MKRSCFLLFAMIFLMMAGSVSADSVRMNPSLYSFAEIVQKLPSMWLANPIEVTEMMNEYPDFVCYRNFDVIGCQSVNNKFSSEIHVNLQFTSDDDNAEFQRAVFTMPIDSSEQIQTVVEQFWLDGLSAAKIGGAGFPEGQIVLYFSNDSTLETYTIYMTESGGFWLLTVDIGLIRG